MHVNIGETVRIEAIVVDYNEREGIAKLRIEGLEDDILPKQKDISEGNIKILGKVHVIKNLMKTADS